MPMIQKLFLAMVFCGCVVRAAGAGSAAASPIVVPASAPRGEAADLRESLKAALELSDDAAAVAAGQRVVDAHPKEAEAALMEITPPLKDPARARAIHLLARRPESEALSRFFRGKWPVADLGKGPVDRDALQAVMEISDTSTCYAALDKLIGDRKEDAEGALLKVFPDLNKKGEGQAHSLFWLSARPDSPAIRAFYLRWAADGNDDVRLEIVREICLRADAWPAEEKAEAAKCVLARLQMNDDGGGREARWLARQGVAEALPILQRRLQRLAKAEGPAKRYELSGAAVSSNQGQTLAALAILGDAEARRTIRDSLAQDLDVPRLAWGIWAATETADPSWAQLVADHLDDGRTFLPLGNRHNLEAAEKPIRSKAFRLRIDAMVVQSLAMLCRPTFSFTPRRLGLFAEYDYPPLRGEGDWDIVPQGFTPAHMKEVRDWWAHNRDKWPLKPIAPPAKAP
jgi:hypothetical protein